jgi:ariadne-1
MQTHCQTARTTAGTSNVRGDNGRERLLGERNRIRRSPLRVVQPRRAVEREPLTLLSHDTMAALFDEQLHKDVSAAKPKSTTVHSHDTTLKHRRGDRLEPQQEPRTSSSRQRTSTASSSMSSLAPPSPQPTAADEAIARIFDHSIVLNSAAPRDCQVCYERMAASDAHNCPTCHGVFCVSCVRWYMEYKILEGEVSEKKLVCPAPQCMRALPHDFIQTHVAPATYAKYLQYRENQQPGVRFCPRPGCCKKIQEPLFTTTRRACCAACGHESCMKCGEAFHLVATCRRQEKRYGQWRTRSNVHKCPSCKSDIEKQGGCAHMRCFQCDAEFCWSCLRPWATHDETLCVPLSFLRSKNPKFGGCKPVRAVTKTVAVSAAVVVGAAGVGVGLVVLPPVLLVRWLRTSSRFQRQRESLHSDSFIVE